MTLDEVRSGLRAARYVTTPRVETGVKHEDVLRKAESKVGALLSASTPR